MKYYSVFIAVFCLVLLGSAEKYNLIFEGDSITALPSSNFTGQTYDDLGIQGKYVNHGTPRATMCEDIYRRSDQIDALYDANYDENIAVLWAGTNDLTDGFKDDQINQTIADWCKGRMAVGYRVIVSTLTPKTGATEIHRQAVNTFIRTHWHEFADGLTDPGDNATLANCDDTTYYADGIHMTHEGATIAALLARTAILGSVYNMPKRCAVSGKWSIRFNDNKDKSMDLNLWISGGTVMGYGTLTEAGAKNSVTAVGSVNPRELTLIAKSAAPNQANKEGEEYDLDLFVVNCAHSGTYVLKSGKLPLHNGNVTAVKQ